MTAAPAIPERFTPEWWRTDAAYDSRCKQYIEAMLLSRAEHAMARRIPYEFGVEPDWPAVMAYDGADDARHWVECKSTMAIRDYLKSATPGTVNSAALMLANR